VIHPDGSPVPSSEVPASVALRTGKAVSGMILGVRQSDGVTTWLAVDAVPLRAPSGEVEFVTVTISDVTRELVARMQLERVRDSLGRTIVERDAALGRAVQALESSEARYRAVLRSMSEGVAVHAPDGSIVFANPAALRILGLTLEQMQGRHPVESAWRLTDAHGASLPPDQIPSEVTRRTGMPQRNRLVGIVRGRSYERAWLSVNTDPIDTAVEPRSDTGTAVVATFQDITAETRALAEAQNARDHLRDIAAALPGVVTEYVLCADGSLRFRYISEPARTYFGIEPEAAIRDGASALARVHPEDKQALIDRMRVAASGGAALDVDFRLLHADGAYRYARLYAGPPTPVPDGWLFRSVVFDVSEQHRLEERVRESQRREAMGTLAAGIAHNFNNMLAVIVPSLDMLRSEVPESLRADIDDARTAAQGATELVRQLMQLVRKDSQDRVLPVDVAALVGDIAQMCRRTFDTGIEIRSDAPKVACYVLARRAELQQVLMNLCINARDALASRAAPRVELGVTANDDSVLVSVSDNGAGMPPEVQRRIGEPFFTTKPPGRGTGLGLATAYRIVAELGGNVECRSAPSEGTRFELRLPRHRAAVVNAAATGATEASLHGVRVLLIDDEPSILSTMGRALERLGAEVWSAKRGSEGIDLLRAHPEIGLIFLDLAMPELDGTEVLRRIRELSASVPVYIMTGFLPRGLDVSGATAVLTKPIDISKLGELVRSAVGP